MGFVKTWVLKNIPESVLRFLFPSKFSRFIKIFDEIGKRKFKMYLRSDAWIENEILKNGLYGGWEKISLKLWAHLSKHSIVIVDISANTGIYSLLAQNNNVNATVIAVEPVDINYDILARNIRKNKLPVNIEKITLSDRLSHLRTRGC